MKNASNTLKGFLCLAVTALGGCLGTADGTEESERPAVGAINNGTTAQQWMWERSARVSTPLGGNTFRGCTAVIVGRRHVITAAHCTPTTASTVIFYNGTRLDASSPRRSVIAVALPPGVNPGPSGTQDLDADGGKFGDIAVITLASDIPSTSRAAPMAWSYPGNDEAGVQVGGGQHDGLANSDNDLRYRYDTTYSDNVSGGHFLINNAEANQGDSGGGFFIQQQVQGVLYGQVFEWANRNKYTSVVYWQSWILNAMNYGWSHTTIVDTYLSGPDVRTFMTADHDVCAHVCDQDSSCGGYSYYTPLGLCHIKGAAIGSRVAMPGMRSGER